MRVERTYSLRRHSDGQLADRATYDLDCVESSYCEDRACEATHDDRTALWDSRVHYTLGELYGKERAERVLAAVQTEEAARRRGSARMPVELTRRELARVARERELSTALSETCTWERVVLALMATFSSSRR